MGIKKEIKIVMAHEDINLTELVNLINDKFDRKDTIQNLGKKINKETLKYREAEEIAELLGYQIKWEKK